MPSKYVLQGHVLHGTRFYDNIPLLIVAPVSPLESLFIRSSANALSRSLKNDVDSGLFGKRNRARIASRTDGEPYIFALVPVYYQRKGRYTSTMKRIFQFEMWDRMCWMPKAMRPPKAPATVANPNQ